jgi:hypothetical protein
MSGNCPVFADIFKPDILAQTILQKGLGIKLGSAKFN